MSFSHMRRAMRRVGLTALVVFCLSMLPAAAMAISNDDCFGCHSEASMSASDASLKEGGPVKPVRDLPKNPAITFQIDKEKFAKSVHASLSCTDCHKDVGGALPHTMTLGQVDCSGCHAEAAKVYGQSRHAVLHEGVNAANPPRCVDCHGAHDVLKVKDDNSRVSAKNVSDTCMRCHGATDAARRSGIPIPGAGQMYSKSVHYRKIKTGDTSAATCVSCHGGHDIKDRLDPASPVFRTNIPKTCGQCHDIGDYMQSIHGQALLRGVPDAPGCTDCHGDHNILGKDSGPIDARIADNACSVCHSADKMAAKYGVSAEKVKGYKDSFHGLSEALGDARVAHCPDCHTGHAVYPAKDERSSINEKKLVATCGKCHEGITANAAKGNIHVNPGGAGTWIKDIVKKLYFFLIIGTIGGMAGHNALDFYRKMRIRYLARQNAPGYYERLNSSERLQHLLTLTTFITLVITGFALKYKWSLPFVADTVNTIGRGLLHRAAAVIMIGASLSHVYYIITTERGRKQFIQMLPTLKDGRDIIDMLQFYFGIKDHGPRCGRFSYIEKAEYLALLWGTIVMIVTGFILWFSTAALKHIPMWAVDVATLVHYYEAILATLAIIVWHFYYVFINPDFSPMAFTWIDGKLTREQMEHEHPLELEEIEGKKPGSSSHH